MKIETGRLTLREFSHDDLSNLYGLESLPEVVRYQTWEPRTREEASDVLVDIINNQTKDPRRHIELAAIVKSDGGFIGRVGCMTDEPKLKTNVWFAFTPSAQGHGYATEAVKALIETLTVGTTLEIECDPRNTASWKLAERLGFHKTHYEQKAYECKGEWVGSVVYTLLPITES